MDGPLHSTYSSQVIMLIHTVLKCPTDSGAMMKIATEENNMSEQHVHEAPNRGQQKLTRIKTGDIKVKLLQSHHRLLWHTVIPNIKRWLFVLAK